MLDTAKSNRARKKETNEKSLYKIRVENQRAHLPLQDCPADKLNWNKVFPVNTRTRRADARDQDHEIVRLFLQVIRLQNH